jgi:hypothetical protein
VAVSNDPIARASADVGTYLQRWAQDGYFVVTSLLRADEVMSFLEIAERLIRQYQDRDPITGRRGFLVNPHIMSSIDNRDRYADCPRHWYEVMDLIASPRLAGTAARLMRGDPLFASSALLIDPALPYALDMYAQRLAAPDGAGSWHRDVPVHKPDYVEKEELLADREGRNWVQVQIPLVRSNAFEFVPGSQSRWDTPAELVARKHGTTLEERTSPLPGGCRIELEPGDALFVNPNGLHRGWYTHGVRRRTLAVAYSRSDGPTDHLQDSVVRWSSRPEDLEGLSLETRVFVQRYVDVCQRVIDPKVDRRATPENER